MTPEEMKWRGGERFGGVMADPRDGNLAFVVWHSGAALRSRECAIESLKMDAEACDLSLLNRGRAPVLLEHDRHADAVIGIVEQAWLEDGLGFAVIRFGRRQKAQEIRLDVESGILCNCSIGYRISDCVEAEDSTPDLRHFVVTKWAPFEISLVALGEDGGAHFQRSTGGAPPDLAELLERKRSEGIESVRFAKLEALKAGKWLRWAREFAAELAAEHGIDRDRLEASMAERVERHLETLI
jgi:hypothetical protein